MRLVGERKKIFEKYGYHFVFFIALILLVLISLWWTVFINNSIDKLRVEKYENLKQKLNYYALELCSFSKTIPIPGDFTKDKRFEIKKNIVNAGEFQIPLCDKWQGLMFVIKKNVLLEIEKDYRSKKYMVSGESVIFLMVVLVSIFFLYISVRNEKRTTLEIRKFFERVTHEIKTPITGIKALLQSIKNGTIEQEELILYTDLALKQINRQEKLSENILAGAYLKSKGQISKLEKININNYIKQYFDNYSYLKSDLDLSINYLPNEDIEVFGDTYYLKVILDNLVDNAIKYCSPNLKLEIILEESNMKVLLIVRDNGQGIDRDTIGILFEAYRSTKNGNARKNQGSGIGLSISRDMAKKMGSDLKFRNREDISGAEFYLSLNRNLV